MRHFAVVASALLFTGAVSALASVDSGLLAMVPAGSRIVGGVDVTKSRNSEFGQYVLAKTQAEDAHFQEMITETGFDPRRDLQNILFATSGPSGKTGQHSFAILARGTFDQRRIKSLATTKGGATLVTYGGVDMLVDKKSGSELQSAVGFLDTGVAAMADLATLKQMIDNRGVPTLLDADLKSKITSIGNANDVWFVSMVGGADFLAQHMGGGGEGAQAKTLQGVTQSSVGVRLGSTIDTTIDAETRSAQDAQSLSDVIRFMASMVQMQRQNDPRAGVLANALDGMTLQNTGTSVHFAGSVPEKTLEQLADSGGKGGGAAR